MKQLYGGSLIAIAALMGACGGGDGTTDGEDDTTSTDDGTSADGEGSATVEQDGSCAVQDNEDGTATITCDDGSEVTIATTPETEIERCTATDNGDGTVTLTCPDGTSFTTDNTSIDGAVRFVTHVDTASDIELYQVAGSSVSSWRVNKQLESGVEIPDYLASADNTQLLYRADHDETDVVELYLVDISGEPSAPEKVSGSLQPDGDVQAVYAFSPDGNWVAYRADQDDEAENDLYVVDISGNSPGSSVKVSGDLATDGDVSSFRFSPDSNLLAYRADGDTDGVLELYLVDLSSPGAGTKVNTSLSGSQDVTDSYSFSPDSASLYYLADENTNDDQELFVSAVGDGTPGTPDEVSDISTGRDVLNFQVSPDSGWVVYQANEDDAGVNDLYLVAASSPGTALNLYTDDPAALVHPGEYAWSGNSQYVVFRSDLLNTTDAVNEVLSVEINGGSPEAPQRLNDSLPDDADVDAFQMNAAGDRVLYYADQGSFDQMELFVANPAGSLGPHRVNAPLSSGQSLEAASYAWAEDASVVRYAPPVDGSIYGTGLVDLSGDTPSEPRLFFKGTGISAHIIRTLSEDGQHVHFSTLVDDVYIGGMDGSLVTIPLVYTQPIEFVNPKN